MFEGPLHGNFALGEWYAPHPCSSVNVTSGGANSTQAVQYPVDMGPSPDLMLELRATAVPLVILEISAWMLTDKRRQAATVSHVDVKRFRTFALEPLRFLGVMHIVLFHEAMMLPGDAWQSFAMFGKYWVQFFFLLSGFALYISQKGATTVQDHDV